jgi:methionine-rich copper-binding protein CopC
VVRSRPVLEVVVSRRAHALLVVVITAVLAASGALLTPASAHAKLDSSNPANGAALDAAPTSVSLTFDEPVTDPVLKASDDAGVPVALGDPSISGSTITASWPAGSGGGLFRVEWQVKSDDGDVVDGVILFSVAGPKASGSTAVPAPGGTTEAPSSSGLPGWLWPLVAVLVIGAGVLALLARRSRLEAAERPVEATVAAGGAPDQGDAAVPSADDTTS